MVSNISSNPYSFMGQYIRSNNSAISESLERLASGLRVNEPKDDLGAYFVSSDIQRRAGATENVVYGLETEIEGLNSALSALEELQDILDTLKDLAQDAAGAATAPERQIFVDEYKESVTQFDALVDTFDYRGVNLIASETDYTIQVDENVGDILTYTLYRNHLEGGLNAYSAVPGEYLNPDTWVATPGNATDSWKALNGIIPYNSEAAGSVLLDRNLARISNTKALLEGRRTTLQNKITNYEAVVSALTGLDEAEEATKLSALQIQQQAGAHFLAQANSNTSSVFKLLYSMQVS
jgi:flagellin